MCEGGKDCAEECEDVLLSLRLPWSGHADCKAFPEIHGRFQENEEADCNIAGEPAHGGEDRKFLLSIVEKYADVLFMNEDEAEALLGANAEKRLLKLKPEIPVYLKRVARSLLPPSGGSTENMGAVVVVGRGGGGGGRKKKKGRSNNSSNDHTHMMMMMMK